jgi:glutamyl-tRNA synthetase
MNVVTRIAPSPTGRFHIGTARTALFNYLYARKHGGKFLIRIEDTDKERSDSAHEKDILNGLSWLGLTHDEEIVRQSSRQERHTELLTKLVQEDKAYVSKEPSAKEEGKEVEVVRLRNIGRSITFADEVRGNITFDTTELKDFVIGRAIDDPLYHFAVVVDDADMGVTHVIRGEDHISNTPRQILIQEALGFSRPIYAHLPLILSSDRSKMSKRHGAVSVSEYREQGFLPEAIVNYLALLGWGPGDDREDFSLAELVEAFDLSGVHKSGAVFDLVKFKSVNQRWMRTLSHDDFITRGELMAPHKDTLRAIVPLLKERAQTFAEAKELLAGEFACFFLAPTPDRTGLLEKEPPEAPGVTKTALEGLLGLIQGLEGQRSPEEVKEALMPYADANPKEKGGRGAVLWPLRYALSGLAKSPDPFTLVSVLGPKESVARITTALSLIENED